MISRSCILAMHVCKYAAKNGHSEHRCSAKWKKITRNFTVLHNTVCIFQCSQGKSSCRTLHWSSIISASEKHDKDKKPDIQVKDDKGNKVKTEDSNAVEEKEKVTVSRTVNVTEDKSSQQNDKKLLHKETDEQDVMKVRIINMRSNEKTGEKTSVIEIIAPAAKNDKKQAPKPKDSKEKIIVENVKEQSLETPKTIMSSEPIKKLKEKILEIGLKDTKDTKSEQAKSSQKKRARVDLSASYLERNFITPVRAMSDFLLKPSDLESLPKTMRRSPYEREPPITVFWRRDVEAKAIEVWGSKEKLQQALIKREIERKQHQQTIFTVKRRLRDYRREMGKTATSSLQEETGLMGRSGKVVLTAVAINASNCLFKLFAWLYTGSHSMFSECIHSLADTMNQLILAYGIHKSVQSADLYHPYGYTNMKYVASLISGVGIFFLGTGLSVYHGVLGLIGSQPVEEFYWAYFILCGSLVSEGATWLVAFNSVKKGAKESNMTVKEYILRGQDPSVNVVLLEDFAAVIGVIVAGTCMGISSLTQSSLPDAIGSLMIGGILGTVASIIIYTNAAALVGRSIPQENLEKINSELEADVMIRAIHDVKGIDMGNYLVRYKAEMDFDGRELTRAYLDKQDLNVVLEDIKRIENIDQLEEFMLKHGETIVDMMGGEIDRIEMKLRKKHPEIRHCDLEIL